MHTSWTQWKNKFSFEIFGESGYLIIESLGGSYGTETLRVGRRNLIGGVPDEEIIEFPGPDISWGEEWKEFVSAIRENRDPMGNAKDGLEAMRMIEAVYRSSKENRPIKISEVK
jgi:predicted dehydrogenase